MSPSQLAPTTRIVRPSRAMLARQVPGAGALSAAQADRLIRAWIAAEQEPDPRAETERNPIIGGW